jgi:hypothetical protein
VIALVHIAALIAVLGTAVVYGTDVFCALVQRPALAAVDDRALVAVMGNVHRYGDRRMPLPGAVGFLGAAISAALAAAAGNWAQAVPAATALVLLVVWLVLYTRISRPINRQFTAATYHRMRAPCRTSGTESSTLEPSFRASQSPCCASR